MKDFEKEILESRRPRGISAVKAIYFCLDALYEDKDHCLRDSINSGLTYEELIGCLLLARDEILDSVLKEHNLKNVFTDMYEQ